MKDAKRVFSLPPGTGQVNSGWENGISYRIINKGCRKEVLWNFIN